jgi:hypothetical protein
MMFNLHKHKTLSKTPGTLDSESKDVFILGS